MEACRKTGQVQELRCVVKEGKTVPEEIKEPKFQGCGESKVDQTTHSAQSFFFFVVRKRFKLKRQLRWLVDCGDYMWSRVRVCFVGETRGIEA